MSFRETLLPPADDSDSRNPSPNPTGLRDQVDHADEAGAGGEYQPPTYGGDGQDHADEAGRAGGEYQPPTDGGDGQLDVAQLQRSLTEAQKRIEILEGALYGLGHLEITEKEKHIQKLMDNLEKAAQTRLDLHLQNLVAEHSQSAKAQLDMDLQNLVAGSAQSAKSHFDEQLDGAILRLDVQLKEATGDVKESLEEELEEQLKLLITEKMKVELDKWDETRASATTSLATAMADSEVARLQARLQARLEAVESPEAEGWGLRGRGLAADYEGIHNCFMAFISLLTLMVYDGCGSTWASYSIRFIPLVGFIFSLIIACFAPRYRRYGAWLVYAGLFALLFIYYLPRSWGGCSGAPAPPPPPAT